MKQLKVLGVGWRPKTRFANPTVAALPKRSEIEDVLGSEPYH
ncbi:MAG: hypothetical protein U0270_17600 [Labilithrix sp.]